MTAESMLQRNFAYARQAMEYARGVLWMGAPDRASDTYMAPLSTQDLLVMAQRTFNDFLYNDKNAYDVKNIRARTQRSALARTGNCNEFAELAFIYLLDVGVSPLDLMADLNNDHAFVVIGREPKSFDHLPSEWGPNAIVCDPWDERVYPPRGLMAWKGKKFLIQSNCRVQ